MHYDFNTAPGTPAILKQKQTPEAYRRAVLEAILGAQDGKPVRNLATEVSDDFRLRSKSEDRGGLFLDERALATNVFSAGGALVGEDGQALKDYLRGTTRVLQAGAALKTGLMGDYAAPFASSDFTWTWMAQGGTITPTNITTGRANGSPHQASTALEFSGQLALQRPDAPDAFATWLVNSAGFTRDQAALAGSGVSGQPLGILYTDGANDVDFGGVAATLAKMTTFFKLAEDGGATAEDIVVISHPDVRAKHQQIQRWTNASVALWADDDTILGRKALTTTACPSGRIVAGDWKHMTIGSWGAGTLHIIINPFSKSTEGKISIVASMFCDVITERPAAFSVSTNSAIL